MTGCGDAGKRVDVRSSGEACGCVSDRPACTYGSAGYCLLFVILVLCYLLFFSWVAPR